MKLIRRTRPSKLTPAFLTLSNAMICLDCEHIYAAYNPHDACPKCGSGAVQRMSRWVPTFRPVTKMKTAKEAA